MPKVDKIFEDNRQSYMGYIKAFSTGAILCCVAHQSVYSQPANNAALETTLTVTVQTPDGKPLPHATVVCGDSSTNIILNETTIKGGRYRLTTDDNGRFEFAPKPENLYFMLATEAGFCLGQSRDLTNHPVMTLQPWGHIEGVRLNRNHPLPAQPLMLNLDARCVNSSDNSTRERVYVGDKTTTDSQGHFTFDHVPPGGIVLLEVERSKALWNLLTFSSIRPGEHKAMNIKTEGRFIVAEVEAANGLPNDLNLTNCEIYMVPVTPHPRMLPTVPKEFDTPEKRTQWWEVWYQSETGRLMFPSVDRRGTDLIVRSNGICASEHFVAPAKFWISGSLWQNDRKIAKVDQYVEISDDGANTTNDSVNIGKILLKPAIQEGDLTPDFTVKTLDGEPLKLSSFRGKYVLLDFWATWCGPCVAETPNLKATYDAYGKNARLAMVSLSLDADMAAPKKFVQNKVIHWTQGFLGDWSQDNVTKDFEVAAIPSIWLIGPDGKVISRDLRGEKIKEAVSAALATK